MSTSEIPAPAAEPLPPPSAARYTRREVITLVLVLVAFLLISLVAGLANSQGIEWLSQLAFRNVKTDWGEMPVRSPFWYIIYIFLEDKDQLFVGIVFMTIGIQYLTILMWVTLFRGSNLLRLAIGALVVVFCVGWQAHRARGEFDDIKGTVAGASLLALIPYFFVLLPLWALRWWFGWRIIREGETTDLPPTRRLQLMHLFAWSLYLAAPLAIVRMLIDTGDQNDIWSFVIVLGLTLAGLTFVTALAGFLYIWVTLTPRLPVLAWLVTLATTFCLVFAGRAAIDVIALFDSGQLAPAIRSLWLSYFL